MRDNDKNLNEKDNNELLMQVILYQKKQLNWLKAITIIIFILFVASRYFR